MPFGFWSSDAASIPQIRTYRLEYEIRGQITELTKQTIQKADSSPIDNTL